jgi:hypothetical protein
LDAKRNRQLRQRGSTRTVKKNSHIEDALILIFKNSPTNDTYSHGYYCQPNICAVVIPKKTCTGVSMVLEYLTVSKSVAAVFFLFHHAQGKTPSPSHLPSCHPQKLVLEFQ